MAFLAVILQLMLTAYSNAESMTIAPPVAISQPVLKDVFNSPFAGPLSPARMIATNVTVNSDPGLRFVVFLEVRDSHGITVYLQFHTVAVEGNDRLEIASLWLPQESGSYELRAFAVSNFTKPVVLSDVVEERVTVSS
jgi:hypothetical protein